MTDTSASGKARRALPSTRTGVRLRTVTLALSLAALLIGLTALAGCSKDSGPGAAPSLGKASAFSLPDQNGNTYSFDPRAGKPAVLVFYMGYF